MGSGALAEELQRSPATGLPGITYLLVEQVHSFRVEFGGDHSGSG
jgi:hypothetical protein